MFVAILAVVSLSMMATVKKVKMYDRPFSTAGQVMHSEVPTTVTYQGDSIHMVSDSLLTNVNIVVRSVSGEILLQRENQTVGTTPLSYFVSNIVNTDFEIFMFSGNDFLYYGNSSNTFVDSNVAAYHVNQLSAYHGSQVHYYLELMEPTSLYEPLDYHWLVYVDQTLGSTNRHDFPCYRIPCNQSNLDNIDIEYLGDVNTTIDSINSLNPVFFQSYQYGSNCNLKPSVSVSNIQNDAADNTYAIIVGGGTNKYNNYEEYWNDCSFMYQTLTNRFRIPKSNISLFFGAGPSNGPSVLRADFQGINVMSKDFDMDGNDENVQSTDVDDFLLLLDSLATIPNIDKTHLFFFFIGDGVYDNNDGYIYFWENDIFPYQEPLSCNEFVTKLNSINAHSCNFYFGQGTADSFMRNFNNDGSLSGMPFVATAANSGMCSNKPYHEFVYNWLCALNEKDIHQNNSSFPPFPVPQYNLYDSNGDCQITMNEAYNYAVNHSSAVSSYESNPYTFFNEWAFTTLAPDTCDLYVRDFANDSGAVPSMLILNNSSTSPSSPDIYLRNTDDGITNQTNQQPDFNNSQAYLYTRVHNRGLNDFTGGGVYIHAYWFIPSSYGMGGQWLAPINSDSDFGPIGVKEIGDCIEERNDSIQKINWQIPNNLGTLVTSSLGYLVELTEDSTRHAVNASEFNQLYSRAANSNDITYRKILFGNITPFQNLYSVDLTKGDDENSTYEILSESGNDNCTIEENGDMLHVEINLEANAPEMQIYHVVQKSDITGKLEDELTIQLNRVGVSESTEVGDETSSNRILSLTKDQSQTLLTVRLQNPATNNTQICVESVTTSVTTQSYNLNEGLSEMTIPVNTLTDGFYNVTLKINGTSVDSKKIY